VPQEPQRLAAGLEQEPALEREQEQEQEREQEQKQKQEQEQEQEQELEQELETAASPAGPRAPSAERRRWWAGWLWRALALGNVPRPNIAAATRRSTTLRRRQLRSRTG
jgi:hypothetical protein